MSPPGSAFAVLYRRLRGFRAKYAAALLCLALGTLLGYGVPLVTRVVIDSLLAPTGSPGPLPDWLGDQSAADYLGLAWLAIAGSALLSCLFMYAKGRFAARASEGVVRRLRDELYDHLQHLPCSYYDQAETGDLVQRCTSDVETLRHFLSIQVVEIGRAALLLLTVIPLMLALDVPMTLVSVALAPVIVGFSVLFFRRIRPSFQRMDEAEGRMTAVLQENLTGIRVVRAFARQEHEQEKFARANDDYRRRNYRLICLISLFWPVSDMLVFAQEGAVLLAGAYWVQSGRLSVGTLVAFFLLVNMYVWPVRHMGRVLTDLGKALVSLQRIDEILSQPRESAGRLRPPQGLQGGLRVEEVRFAYRELDVLRRVTLDAPAGSTVALVGASGAGKSTLIRLLLRLYDGAGGTIALDGHELGELERKWVRSQISVVMQEPFLYSKTIRENLLLGRPEATEEELLEAARTADIHATVLAFPDGYDTLVGERGVTLSGGQRQRLALARALLERPAILILDDALSAVDTETEARILNALRIRQQRHTTIVVAHRLSTLRQADQIIVLDDGRVAERGRHDELLQSAGAYQRLWRLQSAPDAWHPDAWDGDAWEREEAS